MAGREGPRQSAAQCHASPAGYATTRGFGSSRSTFSRAFCASTGVHGETPRLAWTVLNSSHTTTRMRAHHADDATENTMPTKTNGIALLKKDHQKVKELLGQLMETGAAKRREQLLAQLAMELEIHMIIEEEIFYPTFRAAAKKKEGEKLYFEATEEHYAAKVVLADLMKADAATPKFGGKAKVLKELVEHHIKEEEKELFPKAKQLFDNKELADITLKMEERRAQLKGELKKNGAAKKRATAKGRREAPAVFL